MNKTYAKIILRLLPLLCAMYVLCYIDRINVSFAQFTMGQALKFSDMVYATGAGIFFWGYFIFEVPSNILLRKVGVKVWFARIMITWGAATIALAFVKTSWQFYTVRFLIGAAEAGFYPGVIYYLNLWFPQKRMARVIALFYLGMPVSGIIGGPLAGLIICYMDGLFGLGSWQYIFIIEGVLPLLAGLFVVKYLPAGPQEAAWLCVEEKTFLADEIHFEKKEKGRTRWGLLFSRAVLLLTAAYFLSNLSQFCFMFWLPQSIKAMSGQNNAIVAFSTAIIWCIASVIMLIVARQSDASGERRWHFTVVGFVIFSAYWFLLLFPGGLYFQFALLSICAAGICLTVVLFWATVSNFIEAGSLAVMVAFINSVGHLGGYFSPLLFARIKAATGEISVSLFIVGGITILGSVLLIQFLPWGRRQLTVGSE